jgi:hypothetical protein
MNTNTNTNPRGSEPISILDLTIYRTGKDSPLNGGHFADADLPMLAGCEVCGESLGPWNAYPSKSGYIRCKAHLGDLDWTDLLEAHAALFESAAEDEQYSEEEDEGWEDEQN